MSRLCLQEAAYLFETPVLLEIHPSSGGAVS